jgi:hypothetical protein
MPKSVEKIFLNQQLGMIVFDVKGRIQNKGIREKGAEGNIWTEEG